MLRLTVNINSTALFIIVFVGAMISATIQDASTSSQDVREVTNNASGQSPNSTQTESNHTNRRVTADATTHVSLNLSRLLESIDETADIRAKFLGLDQQIKQHRETKQQELEVIRTELEALEPESDKFIEKRELLLTKSAELNAWLQVRQGVRDMEETTEYIRMYERILVAAEQMAKQSGYDFVILDDSDVTITPGSPAETAAQLFARRMIYANPTRDITDELITRMNNEYNAR